MLRAPRPAHPQGNGFPQPSQNQPRARLSFFLTIHNSQLAELKVGHLNLCQQKNLRDRDSYADPHNTIQ